MIFAGSTSLFSDLHVFADEGQMQSLSPSERSLFLDEFLALNNGLLLLGILDPLLSPAFERTMLSCNIAWWVCSQDGILRNGCNYSNGHDHARSVSWLFFYAHESVRWKIV